MNCRVARENRHMLFRSCHLIYFKEGIRPGTRIFSPYTVPRLCVTIGHYLNLFKRLTAVG
jgi:hypothetical protein